jgi:hypothetical protein
VAGSERVMFGIPKESWLVIKARLLLFGVFLSMIVGMVGKTYYDHLTKNTAEPNIGQFLIPIM